MWNGREKKYYGFRDRGGRLAPEGAELAIFGRKTLHCPGPRGLAPARFRDLRPVPSPALPAMRRWATTTDSQRRARVMCAKSTFCGARADAVPCSVDANACSSAVFFSRVPLKEARPKAMPWDCWPLLLLLGSVPVVSNTDLVASKASQWRWSAAVRLSEPVIQAVTWCVLAWEAVHCQCKVGDSKTNKGAKLVATHLPAIFQLNKRLYYRRSEICLWILIISFCSYLWSTLLFTLTLQHLLPHKGFKQLIMLAHCWEPWEISYCFVSASVGRINGRLEITSCTLPKATGTGSADTKQHETEATALLSCPAASFSRNTGH